mmetsp:Transcript_19056/g.21945  ORF Transcript_19056/g.21945 Transcript_19056/m.21945 type:complete len:121 (+) Transcript_19056:70-432(+)
MGNNLNYTMNKVTIKNEIYKRCAEEPKHISSSMKSNLSISSGIEELALKSTEFKADKIEISSACMLKSREIHERLGQYEYKTDYKKGFGESVFTNDEGKKWIYVGQFKKDFENTAHGIGI